MIFVTVGTHEQPFNRLIKYIDELKKEGIIKDEVIMQIGYCTYEPKYCKWSKLISPDQMQKNIEEARIIITHGGPASFIAPLQIGKIPIVLPRQKKFDEHVNNHQLEFAKAVKEKYNSIIVIENIEDLKYVITNYENISSECNKNNLTNNEKFSEKFEKIVNTMFEGEY